MHLLATFPPTQRGDGASLDSPRDFEVLYGVQEHGGKVLVSVHLNNSLFIFLLSMSWPYTTTLKCLSESQP